MIYRNRVKTRKLNTNLVIVNMQKLQNLRYFLGHWKGLTTKI